MKQRMVKLQRQLAVKNRTETKKQEQTNGINAQQHHRAHKIWWVRKPRYSERVKAWYLPSEDPAVPLFGTINGAGMNPKTHKVCMNVTSYDRGDAGMIDVKKYNITGNTACPAPCQTKDKKICECG